MTHLYNEILFCYEKEQIIGASNTLNGSQGHYGEGKKAHPKRYNTVLPHLHSILKWYS